MVSAAQKAAIRESWAGIDLQTIGTAFYKQLQTKEPEVFAVFNIGSDAGKLAAQGLKVMVFVDIAVKGLDDMAAVGAKLDELAQRHTKYAARKAHFAPAGPCLLAALAEVCGSKFTPAAKEAWTALYAIIANKISAPLS